MSSKPLTLLISDKVDSERDAVAAIWKDKYGPVLRLGKFWEPPDLDSQSVRVYGADTFCQVLAQILGLDLIAPSDDLMLHTPFEFLGRKIYSDTLDEVAKLEIPIFVKPLQPKLFNAGVVRNRDDLMELCFGLDSDTPLMVSELVEFVSEARFFILDSEIVAGEIYEGGGSLKDAWDFASLLATNVEFPRTLVVDVGLLFSGLWRVVEYNATWGSGLNGCNADPVTDCIEAATICVDA